MIRAVLLVTALLAATAWAQEDEFVIVPRSEIRLFIAELNRLRGVIEKLTDRLIGCQA